MRLCKTYRKMTASGKGSRIAVVAVAIVVALAVGAAAEARLGEEALVQLALLAEGDFGLEDVNFTRQTFGQFPGELLLPLRIGGFHDGLFSLNFVTRYLSAPFCH